MVDRFLSSCTSARPSIHLERRHRSNSLRISAISLKCGGVMYRLLFRMVMLGQFLRVPRNFEIFYDRIGPVLMDDVTALTPCEFQLSAWHLVGWCTVSWSRLLVKMAMLGRFFARPRVHIISNIFYSFIHSFIHCNPNQVNTYLHALSWRISVPMHSPVLNALP